VSSRRYVSPREFVATGGQWPRGPLVDDAPNYAQKTSEVVRRLETALQADGRSARQLALAADIDPGTLSRLRAGHVVPDLATLSNIEVTLSAAIWCARCASDESERPSEVSS
jgi:hypothetical protein